MQSTQVESTYGESISPEKAPEAISKAIAALPPEQMYELMKQMKHCVQVFNFNRLFNFFIAKMSTILSFCRIIRLNRDNYYCKILNWRMPYYK